jgi:catechol 2,3-dioxygenase-like lactoylglutathione lyase family enzyme
MLGQFLEYSVAARPLAPSFEFYRALGFASLPVGDVLPEAYLVLFDGRIAVGLHDREAPDARITFARPNLRDYVRALKRLDIAPDAAHLRDNEFHSVAFKDPSGQSIELVEARTFPPGEFDAQNVAACGELIEVSLPAESLEASSRFWRSLGFAAHEGGEAPHAWQRLTGYGLTLGLHAAHFRPGLSFRCPDLLPRVEYLRAKGLPVRTGNPLADRHQAAATLAAPEGTTLYLFERGAQ